MPDYSTYPKWIPGSGDQYFVDDQGVKRQVPRTPNYDQQDRWSQNVEPAAFGQGFGKGLTMVPKKEGSVFEGSSLRQTPLWPILDKGEDFINKMKSLPTSSTIDDIERRKKAAQMLFGGFG